MQITFQINIRILVDKNELVIVQRGKNKAYRLTAISDLDRFVEEPTIKNRLAQSISQADGSDLTLLKREDIIGLPGLQIIICNKFHIVKNPLITAISI